LNIYTFINRPKNKSEKFGNASNLISKVTEINKSPTKMTWEKNLDSGKISKKEIVQYQEEKIS
jgi:hypothetical protein